MAWHSVRSRHPLILKTKFPALIFIDKNARGELKEKQARLGLRICYRSQLLGCVCSDPADPVASITFS